MGIDIRLRGVFGHSVEFDGKLESSFCASCDRICVETPAGFNDLSASDEILKGRLINLVKEIEEAMTGLSRPHILIIEDDEDTRFVYALLLQLEGFVITHVGTAVEGIARALTTNYDLIIMDVRLPDGDGVELCQKVRAFNKITPIMFVSAAAYEKDVERGMQAGAQAYLIKPADTESLLDRVKYLIGQKAEALPPPISSALAGLVAEASVAAALIDHSGLYKAVSHSYAAAGNLAPVDLIGKPATHIFPDVSGEAGQMLETVQQSKQPHFISRFPYTSSSNPDRGVTYWDAAIWPIESGESGADILIVVRQKEQSGDIAMASQ